MEEKKPKHASSEQVRGTIKLSDLRPSKLHPKAKMRMLLALLGTFLIVFGCIYMLSTSVFYFNPNIETPEGLVYFLKDLVNLGYVVGSILVIIILWYVLIKDCPISPAAKLNYNSSHDKSIKGVKVITAVASAIANKGSGNSLDTIAVALDDYFDEGVENNGEYSEHSSNQHGASV